MGVQWCHQTQNCFMLLVEKPDSDTLLRVIKELVETGTTIISDCWKTCNCLSSEGFNHVTVNESINLVEPNNKATNTIERMWREVKGKVPLYSRRKKHFVGYQARSMFIMAHKDRNKQFHMFLKVVSNLYNPFEPTRQDLS